MVGLTSNYFWTWDHSTNWVLDDEGLQTSGCANPYLKAPETFVEDYRRLTDMAAADGIGGILIWGFVRDSHGGIDAAKEVAHYAAANGVRIMPGLGTTAYGGAYYEGTHEFNQETFLAAHPDCTHVSKEGQRTSSLCPSHPDVIDWMKRSAEWLMTAFEIGGVNLENGDFLTCYCDRCKERSAGMPDQPEYYKAQMFGYGPSLEALAPYLEEDWITYATYSGFNPVTPHGSQPHQTDALGDGVPSFVSAFADRAMCQWTLSGMVRPQALPLTDYLDCGAPEAVYDNPNWPRGLKAPTRRSVGFIHQGSQWGGSRYSLILSTIKEGCLRAAESGLEGVSIHGEMTSRYIPWWLNYRGLAHFAKHPTDDLRSFADACLAPVLGGDEPAQIFIESLARWDAGAADDGDAKRVSDAAGGRPTDMAALRRQNLWQWLLRLIRDDAERATRSFL